MSPPARHIAFVSPLGGTGQTTLLANVATLLAQQHWPCLAVDLCAQNALGHHLGQDNAQEAGWAHRLEPGDWLGDAAWVNQDGLGFIPFGAAQGPSLARLEQATSGAADWLQRQLLDLNMNPRTLVLLDAPTWPSAMARQALHDADLVVVAVEASDRACAIQAALAGMREQMAGHASMVCAPTRFDPRRPSQQQALQTLARQWGQRIVPYVLHEDESMASAWQERLCVVSHAPESQAAHDLQGITNWLLQACGLLSRETA